MATNANWTVVFEDKCIIKNFAEGAQEGIGYVIDDDVFWNQSKFLNIWVIQHGTSVTSDEVEHRDGTAHISFADADLGNFSDFTSKWDAFHLEVLQSEWDNDNSGTGEGDNFIPETEAEKIFRLGARPTSYSS